MNRSVIETLTGGAVVALAASFLLFGLQAGNLKGESRGSYVLYADFSRVDGLNTGADVKISGVKVGSVRQITLGDGFRAKVALAIDPRYTALPADSVVKINSDGLLGGSHVGIEPGSDPQLLKAGDSFEHTQGAVSLMDLISRAVFSSATPSSKSGS